MFTQREFDDAQFFKAQERERKDLLWAARSRVLTADELQRVRELGPRLMGPLTGQPTYSDVDANKMLLDILFQQFRLRGEIHE